MKKTDIITIAASKGIIFTLKDFGIDKNKSRNYTSFVVVIIQQMRYLTDFKHIEITVKKIDHPSKYNIPQIIYFLFYEWNTLAKGLLPIKFCWNREYPYIEEMN